MSKAAGEALPWWLLTISLLGALLLGAGGTIALVHPAMFVSPRDVINAAVRIYAGYFASRNLALAIMLLATVSLRAKPALNAVMLLIAVIQLLDAATDCVEGRWPIVPGVIVMSVLFFLASARLSGSPFWKAAAWKYPN